MADEETQTTEVAVEGPEAEETPDFAAKLAAAESTNAGLRAMLAHVAPDMDIEEELDNIAFRRDGTPVYIGTEGGPATESKTEPKPKPAPRARPAESRGGAGKPSVKGMDDKGLAATVAKNGMRQFKTD